VTSIERTPRGVVVNDSHGGSDTYDHVVIASHSDQPLAMLSDADDRERAILGAIGYATNTIYYLHRDIRLVSAIRCSRHSRAHFRARLCQDTRNPAKQFPRGLAAPDPSQRRNSLRRTNGAQNASTLTKRALGSLSIYNRPAKIPCT
jgi:hypothetical protein